MITILSITIIPIILWGIYFYFKNPRRQPVSEIIKIFFIGTFSVFPVILFHKYFMGSATDYLVRLFNIADIAMLSSLLQLFLTIIFIIFFIFLFALIQSIILNILHKLPFKDNFHAIYKKMYNLTPLLLFFLLFIITEIIFNFTVRVDFIISLAGSVIIFAVLEEYFKYIINPFLAYKKLTSIGSAVVNALYVGLAFAFIENILFFFYSKGSSDFMTVYAYRSVFTTLLHVCASGLLGYFYGMSLFSKSIVANYEIERSQYNSFLWLRKLLGMKKHSIFQSASVTQGFFIVAFIHAGFNLLLLLDLKILAAVLIGFFSLFIVYLLNLESTQLNYSLVGTSVMPDEDFEQLRLKISVAQHLKEIQESHK